MLQVAFSPRELKLFTAGDDAEVRVWDLTKKACIATLKVCRPGSGKTSLNPEAPHNYFPNAADSTCGSIGMPFMPPVLLIPVPGIAAMAPLMQQIQSAP